MDKINQLGKILRNNIKESSLNKRRISENFPQIERVTDKMSPNQSFLHDFRTSKHPHTAFMDLIVSEPNKDCQPQPIDVVASAEGDCPSFPGSDGAGGIGYAVYPLDRFVQVGGFTDLYPSSGMVVPVSGYYSIRFTNGPAGVRVGNPCYVLAGIAVNGGSVAQQIYDLSGVGLAFVGPSINVYAPAVFLAAGDVVAGYMQAVNIAFWTPSDICGFTGGQGTIVTLVGAA